MDNYRLAKHPLAKPINFGLRREAGRPYTPLLSCAHDELLVSRSVYKAFYEAYPKIKNYQKLFKAIPTQFDFYAIEWRIAKYFNLPAQRTKAKLDVRQNQSTLCNCST